MSRKTRSKMHEPSRFFCVECGNEGFPIMRKPGSQKEKGHLKKLFCLHCGKQTNHCEIKPFGTYTIEDFQEEFVLGRFTDEGKRIPVSELLKCSKENCEYNKNGRCWNSNFSNNCGHRIIKVKNVNAVDTISV